MPEKDDLTNTAVYFNNEYLGEAKSFKFKKGNKKQMAILEIKGDYQAGEK